MSRVSSLDEGYTTGDLSVFPDALDDKDSLYQAKNNAETMLKHGLPYNGAFIIVEDASAFPSNGLLKIGPKPGRSITAQHIRRMDTPPGQTELVYASNIPGEGELVYYGSRTATTFANLIRGFAGSKQYSWPSETYVANAVFAEHHNSIKDALINVEQYVGVDEDPAEGTLNYRLKALEDLWLAPTSLFRAYPRAGSPPMKANFQNICTGDVVRYYWEFGDGGTSLDPNPSHTYLTEGVYTVKLTIVTTDNGQGVTTKDNYITVSEEETTPFFYVVQTDTTKPAYSTQTATERQLLGEDAEAAVFRFVDQTDGDVMQRYWIFDDGTQVTEEDPNVHVITHTYNIPGAYSPSVLLIFSDLTMRRAFLTEIITVL